MSDHPGKALDEEYCGEFLMSDGRVISNTEMSQIMDYRHSVRWEKFQAIGKCCDDGPTPSGGCRHGSHTCFKKLEVTHGKLQQGDSSGEFDEGH